MTSEKTVVLNHLQIKQKIDRIAYQLFENFHQEKELIIAGIAPNGNGLAQRIATALQACSPLKITMVEIKLEKDDPLSKPVQISIPADQLKDKVIVVVDDVLNSGRTMIYALLPFLQSQVKQITTVVLVARSYNRFPVKADIVGMSISTTMREHIEVDLKGPGMDTVYLR